VLSATKFVIPSAEISYTNTSLVCPPKIKTLESEISGIIADTFHDGRIANPYFPDI